MERSAKRGPRSLLLARAKVMLPPCNARLWPVTQGLAISNDARNLLHDYAALYADTNAGSTWKREETLFTIAQLRWATEHARLLDESADVFLAAAALGDVALLRVLFHRLATWRVDTARMLELACINGHVETATWICEKVRGTADEAQLRVGVDRAIETLARERDTETLQRFQNARILDETQRQTAQDLLISSIPRADVLSPTDATPPRPIRSPALDVLTLAPLMARIGAFQETAKAEMDRFIIQIFRAKQLALAPWIAITEGNVVAFKMLVMPFRPFRLAMHVAACEDQVDILRWLHTRYGSDADRDLHCRPDTMAMAVRCGAARAVEWLHRHCPASAQTMSTLALNDAARQGHVDVLRVCHRLAVAPFTSTTLASGAAAGSLAVVQFLQALDARFVTPSAMDAALVHEHMDVVRFLLSIQGDLWPGAAAMDAAIERGSVAVVRFGHEQRGEVITPTRLLLAMTASATTMRAGVVQYVWDQLALDDAVFVKHGEDHDEVDYDHGASVTSYSLVDRRKRQDDQESEATVLTISSADLRGAVEAATACGRLRLVRRWFDMDVDVFSAAAIGNIVDAGDVAFVDALLDRRSDNMDDTVCQDVLMRHWQRCRDDGEEEAATNDHVNETYDSLLRRLLEKRVASSDRRSVSGCWNGPLGVHPCEHFGYCWARLSVATMHRRCRPCEWFLRW